MSEQARDVRDVATQEAAPEAVGTPGHHGDGGGLGEQVTGDIVIDAALLDLQQAPADDLDATIGAGQRVHETLQARLSDLGGE